jgi:hypothetical protein
MVDTSVERDDCGSEGMYLYKEAAYAGSESEAYILTQLTGEADDLCFLSTMSGAVSITKQRRATRKQQQRNQADVDALMKSTEKDRKKSLKAADALVNNKTAADSSKGAGKKDKSKVSIRLTCQSPWCSLTRSAESLHRVLMVVFLRRYSVELQLERLTTACFSGSVISGQAASSPKVGLMTERTEDMKLILTMELAGQSFHRSLGCNTQARFVSVEAAGSSIGRQQGMLLRH